MAVNLSGVQAGTVKSNNLNDPETRVIRGKNQFPQSFYHPSTCRYGEVDPVFAMRCERGDTVPYRFSTDLNTFTLQSPLKSPVNMYSAAFKVPLEAIYPRNYELMYPVPNKGDDVPEDTRALFDPLLVCQSISLSLGREYDVNGSSLAFVKAYIRFAFIREMFFSSGSLFSKFNMHLDSLVFHSRPYNSWIVDHSYYFDDWFDTRFVPVLQDWFMRSYDDYGSNDSFYHLSDNILGDDDVIHKYIVTFDSSLIGQRHGTFDSRYDIYYISFSRALELLRSGDYEVNFPDDFDFSDTDFDFLFTDSRDCELNIENIIAYQLSCAHFFTNSKIDFIYDAPLWRDNMQSLISNVVTFPSYEWNGINKLYDVMSKAVFSALYDSRPFELGSVSYYYATSFLFNLFSFQRSLRYGDYFTGSRPEPIAPGDINAPVVDGSVNALVMTRRIQFTRFLNKVNISGPRMVDYLTSIFGGKMPAAPKDVPIRLSLERFGVSGFEVNNTGSEQLDSVVPNITTTNLRLDDSRYMFEVDIDEPCILIAVQYFDAHRIYSRSMDRFAFHKTRFDDFIPDMQFTGDQDVKSKELDFANFIGDTSFAYNLRYMEYKQRYSYASGGFVRALPSWSFITDNTDGNPSQGHIDPDYIRSSPSEFDRFYKSLTGWSLGTRFHFITFNTNICAPYRQMVYAPEILA